MFERITITLKKDGATWTVRLRDGHYYWFKSGRLAAHVCHESFGEKDILKFASKCLP